jgi:hypothetical protein
MPSAQGVAALDDATRTARVQEVTRALAEYVKERGSCTDRDDRPAGIIRSAV